MRNATHLFPGIVNPASIIECQLLHAMQPSLLALPRPRCAVTPDIQCYVLCISTITNFIMVGNDMIYILAIDTMHLRPHLT